MTFLTRYRNSLWDLSETVTPQEFERTPVLMPLPRVLQRLYGGARFDEKAVTALSQGRRIEHDLTGEGDEPGGQPVLLSNAGETLLALATIEERQLRPVKVFDLR